MIVLDPSAVFEVLLRRSGAEKIMELMMKRAPVCFPDGLELVALEMLAFYVNGGEVEADRAAAVVQDLADLPAERVPATPLLARTWELFPTLPSIAAACLVLARERGVALVTCDSAIATAAPDVEVFLVD